LKPFFAVQPVNAFVIDMPAFPLQKDQQATISPPRTTQGELLDATSKNLLVRPRASVTVSTAREPKEPAHAAFANAISIHGLHDAFALRDGL